MFFGFQGDKFMKEIGILKKKAGDKLPLPAVSIWLSINHFLLFCISSHNKMGNLQFENLEIKKCYWAFIKLKIICNQQ